MMSIKQKVAFNTPLVLLYHRVADDPINSQMLAVTNQNFESHLKELSENYRVVSLSNLIDEINRDELNADTVAITFDDGYLDNFTNALPLLEKYKLPATIFITTGMIGSEHEFWWDELEQIFFLKHSLPKGLPKCLNGGLFKGDTFDLSSAQGRLKSYDKICAILRDKSAVEIEHYLHALCKWAGISRKGRKTHRILNANNIKNLDESPLIEIGSHTVNHLKLSILSHEEQVSDIGKSKKEIEAIIKGSVNFFSYPYGAVSDFSEKTIQLVKDAGFKAGIANIQGNITEPGNLFGIPRRLVRNWPEGAFGKWLKDKDKDKNTLESQTHSDRIKRLKQSFLTCCYL